MRAGVPCSHGLREALYGIIPAVFQQKNTPMQFPLYFDNNATTPCDPRVLEAMLPCFGARYGNAASRGHALGWQAEEMVEQARAQVAALIGAEAREIVWTSGATEADNLALKGVAGAYASKGQHIVTVATEHKAVLDTAHFLEAQGKRVSILPVDSNGLIDLEQLADAISDDTVLVSVMWANNETGVLQPIAEIGALCRERGVLFHSDATQAVGKIPTDVQSAHIDLMSLTAHKMYGPKGAGALYVRRRSPRVSLAAQMHGGGHERGMRSGTLNVPGIVGFGAAALAAREDMEADAVRTRALRDALERGLLAAVGGRARVNGGEAARLPNTTNISFDGLASDALMAGMPQVACSSGSACSSASISPSHVLRAMGLSDQAAHGSLRFGLSRWTTAEEVDFVIQRVAHAAEKLHALTDTPKAIALR